MTASSPRFVGAFPRADAPLDPPLPEIAFVGRSNVGKSSLLNALVGRRIARISATPGKTRAMNVYVVSARWPVAGRASSGESTDHRPSTTDHAFYALDLPGYGYARVSKAQRGAFAGLLRHVLGRPRLAGTVWLLDIRHEPSADDRAMLDRFAASRTPVLAAVTKSDKLPRGRRLARVRALTAALALDEEQVVSTSARTGDGIAELREAVRGLVEASRS